MDNYNILTKKNNINKKIGILNVKINYQNNEIINLYFNTYKDICIPLWLTAERLEFLSKIIKLYQRDIVICTYPKSGTTFLEQILLLLINGIEKKNFLNPEIRNSYNINNKFGKIWIESLIKFSKEEENIYNNEYIPDGDFLPYEYFLFEIERPALIKTHASLQLILDKNCLNRNKIIIISRNPLDTCVSHYYHLGPTLETKFNFKLNFKIWSLLWLKGLVPYGNWFDWTKKMV